MPFYEFECGDCGEVSTHLFRSTTRTEDICCKGCDGKNLTKIMSRIAVKRDLSSQLSGLDPKYDKMVDSAVARSPGSDPNQLLGKMKPFK